MTELKTTVSHSEVEAFLSCERKHYYGYGLEIQRRYTSDSLSRGVLGHLVLQKYFEVAKETRNFDAARTDATALLAQHMLEHPDELTIANEVLAALTNFWDLGGFTGFEILAVEKEFTFEVEEGYGIPFIIDLIVRAPDGTIGVIDHKFVKNLYSERDTELMGQLAKYVGFLRAMGFPVHWAAYNELRWYQPKNAAPTDLYSFALIDLSDSRIKRTFEEHYRASKRIIQRKQKVVEQGEQGMAEWSADALRVMNSMTCNWCPFRALCVAELNDESPDLVLDREYKKKERRLDKAQELLEIEAA